MAPKKLGPVTWEGPKTAVHSVCLRCVIDEVRTWAWVRILQVKRDGDGTWMYCVEHNAKPRGWASGSCCCIFLTLYWAKSSDICTIAHRAAHRAAAAWASLLLLLFEQHSLKRAHNIWREHTPISDAYNVNNAHKSNIRLWWHRVYWRHWWSCQSLYPSYSFDV